MQHKDVASCLSVRTKTNTNCKKAADQAAFFMPLPQPFIPLNTKATPKGQLLHNFSLSQ